MNKLKYILGIFSILSLFFVTEGKSSHPWNDNDGPFGKNPRDINLIIFKFFGWEDLENLTLVSKGFNGFLNHENNLCLWQDAGLLYQADYPPAYWEATERARKTVIAHEKKVLINLCTTPQEVEQFMAQHQAYSLPPFVCKEGLTFFENPYNNWPCKYDIGRFSLRTIFDDLRKDELYRGLWIAKGFQWVSSNPYAENSIKSITLVNRQEDKENLNPLGWKAASKEDLKTLRAKIHTLKTSYKDKYQREENLEECKGLRADLVRQENPKIIQKAVQDYAYGINGFKLDEEESAALNDLLVNKGNLWARDWKVKSLAFGFYGYPRDPEQAVSLNDEWAAQGDKEAQNRKLEGHCEGKYGYPRDLKKACSYNDLLIEQGNIEAIERKLNSLLDKGPHFGYEPNKVNAFAFIESMIAKENPLAFETKAMGLWGGESPYQQNMHGYKDFIEKSAKAGNRAAILFYIGQVYNGDTGYLVDHSLIPPLLNRLCDRDVRPAQYLKAFCLRQGHCGYEANEEAYQEFVKHHKIAY